MELARTFGGRRLIMLLRDEQIFQHRAAGLAMEQGSAAWMEARTGMVTASRLKDIVARTKRGEYTEARSKYLTEKICERLTGDLYDHYTNAAMQRGIDLEPVARVAYEATRGVQVKQIGVQCHPVIYGFMGSPDGLVGDQGMIEIKTVWELTRFLTLCMTQDFSCFMDQIQGLLDCLGRLWCDLILFDDRLPHPKGLQIFRIQRNEKHIAMLQREVKLFLEELDAETIRANELLGNAPVDPKVEHAITLAENLITIEHAAKERQ